MFFRFFCFSIIIMLAALTGCSKTGAPYAAHGNDTSFVPAYPDFITANKDYFITRIGD